MVEFSSLVVVVVFLSVQLEVKVGDTWKEVVRYDCAHGYAHKDLYNIKGKHKKINIYKKNNKLHKYPNEILISFST